MMRRKPGWLRNRTPNKSKVSLSNQFAPRQTSVTESISGSPPGKRQFRRGVLDKAGATVTSCGPPASHHLRWLASANCLLEIPEDVAAVAAGSQVQVWDLS